MAAAEVLGTLTSQKEPFSHSDMSTIYSKSQWKFRITIELTFMDNIKTWKNTAKRMIDFLPVTWKCCFYSAHFQPGGMFNDQRVTHRKPMRVHHLWWQSWCYKVQESRNGTNMDKPLTPLANHNISPLLLLFLCCFSLVISCHLLSSLSLSVRFHCFIDVHWPEVASFLASVSTSRKGLKWPGPRLNSSRIIIHDCREWIDMRW